MGCHVAIIGQSGQWAGVILGSGDFNGDSSYHFLAQGDIPSGTQFRIDVSGLSAFSNFPIAPPPPPPDYNVQRIADGVQAMSTNLGLLPNILAEFLAMTRADITMWRIRSEEWERQARELKAELEATKEKACGSFEKSPGT